MSEHVRLTLRGDHGAIGAEVVHEALGEVLSIMREAARSVDAPSPNWIVNEIGIGSVYFAIEDPVLTGPGEVVRQGLLALREAALVPPRWSTEMVKSVRNLGRLTGQQGTQGVDLRVGEDTLTIDGAITAHADQALKASEVSWGSVAGSIERWNGHRGEIGMVMEGQPNVVIRYPQAMKERILHEATDHRIEAWGELHRNSAGQPVSLVMAEFEVMGPAASISVDQVAGSLAGILPDTVAEWLEENRGE